MAAFVLISFVAVVVGYWVGWLHACWMTRRDLRSVTRRVGEYVRTDPRRPW